MPILTLQRRVRELGRIRIGQVVQGANGKSRPEKLDRFRLTSASKELLEKVAALYGGEVAEWTPANGGVSQWEVVTTSKRLPIMVPPQPVSQYYELWSGGGCQRRCDGERELLTDKPCLCDPDPTERVCKPTTRLNVVLRDVEGIGVWRLETHGYYAAVELPGVAELLAQAGGYITGYLGLEQRTAKRDGKTRNWMVPTIEVDVTPTALMSGAAGPVALIGSAPVAEDFSEIVLIAKLAKAETLDGLRDIYKRAGAAGAVMTKNVETVLSARLTELRQAEAIEPSRPVTPSTADADQLWHQVLASGPEEWTTDDIERDFTAKTGVEPEKATAADMARYLELVRTSTKAGA